jgi:hypothetical protein
MLEYVDANSTGVTIELANDIAVSEQVEIRKGITLDGKGHTISGADDYSIPSNDTGKKYLVACYAPVTIKNVNFVGNNNAKFGLQFYKADGAKVTDVTFKNFDLGLCVNAANVTATGTIAQENIAWGGINVSYSSNVTFANPGFDASAATLSGVAMIYSDPSDVTNANAKGATIAIAAPAGWTNQSTNGYLIYAPQN